MKPIKSLIYVTQHPNIYQVSQQSLPQENETHKRLVAKLMGQSGLVILLESMLQIPADQSSPKSYYDNMRKNLEMLFNFYRHYENLFGFLHNSQLRTVTLGKQFQMLQTLSRKPQLKAHPKEGKTLRDQVNVIIEYLDQSTQKQLSLMRLQHRDLKF